MLADENYNYRVTERWRHRGKHLTKAASTGVELFRPAFCCFAREGASLGNMPVEAAIMPVGAANMPVETIS